MSLRIYNGQLTSYRQNGRGVDIQGFGYQHEDGVILEIKAFPGARRNEVLSSDGLLKVYVTQIPEKGKANEAIRKLLAQALDLRASQVELLHGDTSSKKRFLIRNSSTEEILKKIENIPHK